MKKDLRNLYVTLISLGLSIIVYFNVMKAIYKDKLVDNDPLNKKILNAPILGKNCCSWWPVSHFIAFMIFSFIWPQYWKHLFALGVGWEFVEWVLKYVMTPKGEELKFKRTRTASGDVEYEQWWSSSKKDVLFNGAGILCGVYLSRIWKEYSR